MKEKIQFQQFEPISKYKLLSSTAGIGGLVPSKDGGTVLISGTQQWKFFENIKWAIKDIRLGTLSIDPTQRFNELVKELGDRHVEGLEKIVHDPRFLYFLKAEYGYNSLEMLISFPDFVSPDRANQAKTADSVGEIPASYFPRYFYDRKGNLKRLGLWANSSIPPKVEEKNPKTKKKNSSALTQVSLVLICANGHLSEIPWSKYITYKRLNGIRKDLFSLPDCCDRPTLRWTENSSKSEGYGSIYIECTHCKGKYSLQGINKLSCTCDGLMPWMKKDDSRNPENFLHEQCDKKMEVSLPTANNIYFANTTSSLFIPSEKETQFKADLANLIAWFAATNTTRRLDGDEPMDRQAFFESRETKIRDKYKASELETLRKSFVGDAEPISSEELNERYRYEEYRLFTEEFTLAQRDKEDIDFTKIKVPDEFEDYFDVICCVDQLKVTTTQLNFSRLEPPAYLSPDNSMKHGQTIHQEDRRDVLCLPAIQSNGEGIFFGINPVSLHQWQNALKGKFFSAERSEIFAKVDHFERERRLIIAQHEVFFLIHTLSHIVMKELEYSCGYPLSSLIERLYISNRMSGFLIFTTDGSEGGMGGLASMATTENIRELLENSLFKTLHCSSDPLCWTNTGAGHASLNLAACFSCSTVSENSCEMRNLGLDRRILSDPDFGFFRQWLDRRRLGD